MARRCLASLARQQFDAARLRMALILVDNNAQPAARPIYDAFCEGREGHRYVYCPRPGIPIARNTALEAALRAGADYIAFIDDDEVAPRHWLGSLLQALEASDADAVQGGVRKLPAGAVEQAAASAEAPRGKLVAKACESLATCNVLFRARLVEPPLSLRFDESMQFTGGSDREFFMRAHKRGARLLRLNGVDVFEEVAEGRESLAYRAARSFATGSNYFTRVCKNEPGPVAAARIALRALEKGLGGLFRLAMSAGLLIALRPKQARAQWRDGWTSLCFAAGCISPLVGVRAYPYRNIQGA
jgi:glycosyltransferase involved in cell wall biosynthesis